MGLARVAVGAFSASSLVLLGLVWVVQLVVYPGFREAGYGAEPDRWRAVHAAHSARMTAAVALPWAVEGLAAAVLLAVRPAGVPLGLVLAGDACAATTVAVTVVWSLPAHARLATGFDEAAWRRLVRTDWLRVVAWAGAAGCGAAEVALLLR